MGSESLIVTGGSGMVGGAFIRAAQAAFRIRNLDIVEGVDITDAAQVERIFGEEHGASSVVHFAAFADVSAAHKQTGDREGLCYRLNVIGTRNVANACKRTGKHLIHISTDFVFDGEREEPYDEQSETNPIEWYGMTKWMAEEEIKASGCDHTIVRIAFPYTGQNAAKLDLVRTLRSKLENGETIKAFSDQIITPTRLMDVIEGLLLLVRKPAKNETYHLVGSTSLSPYELGLKIAQVYHLDENLVQPSSLQEYLKIDPRPRQKCLRVNNAKWSAFAEANGLTRPSTIDEGLNRIKTEE